MPTCAGVYLKSCLKIQREKIKKFSSFHKKFQIYSPQVLKNGDITFLIYNTKEKVYQLYSWSGQKLNILTEGFGSKEVLYDRFRCEDDLYFRSRNGLYRYSKGQLSKSTDGMLRPIIFHRVSDKYEAAIFADDHSGFYYRPSSCRKFAKRYSFFTMLEIAVSKCL